MIKALRSYPEEMTLTQKQPNKTSVIFVRSVIFMKLRSLSDLISALKHCRKASYYKIAYSQ